MDAVTAEVALILRFTAAAAFFALAVVAVAAASRLGPGAWWVAGAFGSLAAVLTYSRALELVGVDFSYSAQTTVLLLVAFPYCLLGFTASFRSLPRWLKLLSRLLGALLAITAIVLPPIPEPLPTWAAAYVAVVLAYWLLLSSVTVVRLWRAGQEQPSLPRRRMRLMAVAACALSVAMCMLVLTLRSDHVVLDLALYAAVLISALGFGLGFSPPRILRMWWGRTEADRLQTAMMSMMSVKTADEIADELLPPTVRMVGGSGAVLVDADGAVMASYGSTPTRGMHLPAAETQADGDGTAREAVSLGEQQGHLVVWTSPYTPFFGREEVDLLHAMGSVAGVALQRAALLAEERDRRTVLELAQRRAEQAKQDADAANLAKSEFLSRMSHELRTPLNAILGFGQLLEGSELRDEDQESVSYILKGGRHLLNLINEVLDLSRIEAGKMSLSLEPVLVSELVDNAVALIRPIAERRSIRLAVDASGCDDFVHTDRQRCSQVLLNLLSNAVKYNYDGGAVEVSCRREGETVRIAVTDSGPGIDPSRRGDIFEPFQRLGAESSGIEGTGLGLALSKQLIETMGGTIGLESATGHGSRFWVDLPVTQPPPEPAAEPSKAEPARAAQERQRTLLLVEDNLANLKLVEAMLRRRPEVSVIPAMRGRLAIELAHEHAPDLIVLDLHLPDLSGQEVLHRLKAHPRTRGIPVVIASADATPGRVRRLCDQGAFDYLTKPLEVQRFLDLVDDALRAD